MKLRYPTKFIGITQGYKTSHLAIDLGWNNNYGGKNCDVYASGIGTVTSIRDGRVNTMTKGDSGNYVTIKYEDGYETRACHLLKGSIKVKKGDKVTANTIIGKMGNSGYCMENRANHVHFIVWKNGIRVNPLNNLYVYEDNTVAKSNTYKLLKYSGNTYQGVFPKVPTFGSLKRGSKGEEVKKLQKFLNWANDTKLVLDGSFGPKVEAQVKLFQLKAGLTQDGHFGSKSLAKAKEYIK